MKSNNARLDDTVTFIRTCMALDAGQRTRAADQAEVYIASLGAGTNALSTALSIGQGGADPANHRKYRRAYVLLHRVLAQNHLLAMTGLPAGDINITGAAAALHLPALVRLTAILRCQNTHTNYMMQQALTDLLNNPLTFLQNNMLMVSGSPLQGQGPGAGQNQMPFYLSFDLDLRRFNRHLMPGMVVHRRWLTVLQRAGGRIFPALTWWGTQQRVISVNWKELN